MPLPDGGTIELDSASGTEISAAIHLSPDVGPPGSIQFPFGFVTYSIQASLSAGATAPISTTSITIHITGPSATANNYYQYGQTPANPTPHWYSFQYNTKTDSDNATGTGAEFGVNGHYILHLIDGGRGDDDGIKNGVISATGGLAITAATDPYAVTNTNDSGAGSLRQAVINANGAPGVVHTITFALPSGTQTINLQSPLPAISDPMIAVLDATQNVTVVLSSTSAWRINNALNLAGAGTLTVSGGVEGTGDLTVNAGSDLTTNHIVQEALVIGGTATSFGKVTIAASDSSGNPLAAANVASTSMHATTSSSQPAAPTTSSSSAIAITSAASITISATTTVSTTPSSPISIIDAPATHSSSGSALAANANSVDSSGTIAWQLSIENAASDFAHTGSNESKWSSSLTTVGVSSITDAARFGERQPAIIANENGEFLHRDAVEASFADADVLEWAAATPPSRLSTAGDGVSLLADDLLDAIGRQWRN